MWTEHWECMEHWPPHCNLFLSPSPNSSATVRSHREGKVEGEPCSESLSTRRNSGGCFGAAVGGLWEYYLQKEQGEKRRAMLGEKKRSRHKRWIKPLAPKRRHRQSQSQWVRTGGCRGTEPRGPSHLLPSSHSLHPLLEIPRCLFLQPGSLCQCGQALLLRLCCVVRKVSGFQVRLIWVRILTATDQLGDLQQGGDGVGVNLRASVQLWNELRSDSHCC